MRVCVFETFNPLCDSHAYFLGLLATDGHISATTRNRGRISFEIATRDANVLYRLAEAVPLPSRIRQRVRDTNFRRSYSSTNLTYHDLGFRRTLGELGYSPGKKSHIASAPLFPYDEVGFWRGVIDGDGSLGFTAGGRPFLSLVTNSQMLRDQYLSFLERYTGVARDPQRNRRDGVFNIMIWDEAAQAVAARLYARRSLAIDRKSSLAKALGRWLRPANRPRRTHMRKSWTREEDILVLSCSDIDLLARDLGRSRKSVAIRRWRLEARSSAALLDKCRNSRLGCLRSS
jgi:hypothetical protein